jgi:chemotaxis signal transduction protein
MTAPTATPPTDAGPIAQLRERARAREGRAELLLFRVGSERFATALAASEEALELSEHPVHPVPGRSPARLGVVAIRGALLPIYTPRGALGLEPTAMVPEMGLVFGVAGGRVALAVDDVEDVFVTDLAELRDAPGAARGATGVVLGVVRHGGALVGIVDAEALLAACRAESIKASSSMPLETT